MPVEKAAREDTVEPGDREVRDKMAVPEEKEAQVAELLRSLPMES
jgi:hypothetical protein